MSYAGPARSRSSTRTSTSSARSAPARAAHARDDEETHETDWQQVAIFGAGLALGLALGAGIAMLTAPQSGRETRTDIARYAGRKRRAVGRKSRDAWLDLRDELRDARQALRRRMMRRSLEREQEASLG